MRLARILVPLLAVACGAGVRYATPSPPYARDARFGWLVDAARPPTKRALCRDWIAALGETDPHALDHVSFPETDPARSCYAVVDHGPRGARVGRPRPGCGYPDPPAAARLARLADELTERPHGPVARRLFDCPLPARERAAALAHDAAVLRRLAERARGPDAARFPYSAIIVPGFGAAVQGQTRLVGWRPFAPCRRLSPLDQERLGVNVPRAVRAAESLRAGVAPVAIVSGTSVRSPVIEAFALAHVMGCMLPVHRHEILVEPCADHTHTNVRNAGRWIVAMGGRAAYLVTDEGLQAKYFQDWSGFEAIAADIDRRALRDWGYGIGSWRQASRGIRGGFWYTPFRFWAEPRAGAGSLTCLE